MDRTLNKILGYENKHFKFSKKSSKVCIYFRGVEDCICNNDPDDPGECLYENGIEPPKPSLPCKYYKVSR